MLEYPVSSDFDGFEPSYISFILQYPTLITIRHNTCPILDDFIQEYISRTETGIIHLVQLLYLIIDEITDLSVQSETELRDKIIEMSRILADNPATVREKELNDLRWEVEMLVSLNENQLYCVHSLSASDNPALNEPHRKAYIQDLASEVEIARNGILRLETRVKDLFDSFQLDASARVEKRLRILTIVSAITLPFGLIAGLLGMNVGGLPGTNEPLGFVFVIALMLIISIAELWYFKRKGWFK